ncbi:hypothetical protein GCM10023215_01290 [Pseudonocardia yuanmonensis]|uniref:Uncharacterized protein n=1 Tax=Pseudonocardia yuanmonensis TaxID=1095914 RepID=A0ABP8VXV8_9PSEU
MAWWVWLVVGWVALGLVVALAFGLLARAGEWSERRDRPPAEPALRRRPDDEAPDEGRNASAPGAPTRDLRRQRP